MNDMQRFNIIFEITERCNADCMYCYNVWKGSPTYPLGELNARQIKKLLKKVMREINLSLITLTGGEPLLRDDLVPIIQWIKRKGVDVNLITNATLLNEENIKRLIDLGVSMFEVPLLSYNRDIHNELMQIKSFDSVTEAIVKIKKYNGHVVTVFVATQKNISDFENTAKIAYALGADGIMLNRFNAGGAGKENIDILMPSVEQLKQTLDIANKFVENYHMPISCSIPIQPCLIDASVYKNLTFGFCAAGTDQAYYTIDSLGNLRMCNHTSEILGSLWDVSFQDLITGESANLFCGATPEFCKSCSLETTCQGGCKASAQVCYGSLDQEEPFLRMRREGHEQHFLFRPLRKRHL
ncbi:MAG: hypothetical protein COS89_06065 [Deltaproteobacteria bacterium CG07_land_8_20_14_0_80_38_7]|nr:MAG: hypothetical protein COS89_06065 [Deltaproteobacteria bacterium CG07_land_8_20_14_0_80_38_7]